MRDRFGALGVAASDVQHGVLRRAAGEGRWWCSLQACEFERVIHSKALTLLLVFGHEPPREAAAVMLFSRVVAPEMFPAVLGACFAEASKLRLQQVMQPSQTLVIFRFIFLQRLGPSVCFDSQGPGGPYVAPHLIPCKK